MQKIFLLPLLFLTLIPSFVSAHVTRSDNGISVLMHLSPDDEPITRVNTDIFFLITDPTNKFALAQCNCVATISSNNKELSEKKIVNSFVSVIFPKKAIYTITVSGKSLNGTFPEFKVSFDVRVDKEGEHQLFALLKAHATPLVLIVAIISLIFLLVQNRKKVIIS